MYESVFEYKHFLLSDNRKEVVFYFSIQKNGESFDLQESYEFDVALPDNLETYRLLRALHLACGISYYKIFVCSDIEHPYAMSTREANFWNTIFKNGLGEFLYVNKLDPSLIAQFSPQEGQDTKTTIRANLINKALLGIGGGKDSAVAGELLKSLRIPVDGFVMATGSASGQTVPVARVMKINLHMVKRTLDPQLQGLQKRQGAYMGHIPVSLLFALTGSLVAIALKSKYVVVANESSASIPHIEWAGNKINHQYSKSFEFEVMLQKYLQDFVSKDLIYFSAIRPLSSVAVAKMFARYPQYFKVFTSDNYGFRVDASKRPDTRWSLQSPKSLSSFILMSAWLSDDQLLAIFGRNFLNEASLEPLFLRLVGIEGEPPLDCVGTPQELRASLGQAFKHGSCIDSALMAVAEKYEIVAKDRTIAPTVDDLLKLSNEQAFAPELAERLLAKINEEVV